MWTLTHKQTGRGEDAGAHRRTGELRLTEASKLIVVSGSAAMIHRGQFTKGRAQPGIAGNTGGQTTQHKHCIVLYNML